MRRPTLRRKLGSFGFFALAFGSIVGVGWVTAMGGWLTHAGPLGAVLAFGAGGALMLAIGLCYAEVTPMLPVAGGEVAYAYKAFGTFKAFVVGWLLAFGYIAVSAFEAISVGKVVSFMLPGLDRGLLYHVAGDPVYLSHLVLALVCTAVITALNWLGVGWAEAFQRWLTVLFLALTALFVAAGLALGQVANARPFFPGGGLVATAGGVLAVIVTVPFWFVGFDTIPQGAEEASASVAPRKLGTLILTAIIGATAFYALLIVSVSLAGPWRATAAAELPTARAFALVLRSELGTQLVLAAALIGLFTSWNGFFLAGSRVVFALGRARIIPERFGETHPRYGTPHRAVLLTGALTLLAPFLGREALLAFVDVGSFCIGAAFLGVALSVIRLRRDFPDHPRPYRIPGGLAIPYIAVCGSLFILAVMVIPGSPAALTWPREVVILALCAAVGTALWWIGARKRAETSEAERAYLVLEESAA